MAIHEQATQQPGLAPHERGSRAARAFDWAFNRVVRLWYGDAVVGQVNRDYAEHAALVARARAGEVAVGGFFAVPTEHLVEPVIVLSDPVVPQPVG